MLGVKVNEMSKLGPPHGQCSSHSPFGDDKYQYTLMSCQMQCAQKAVVFQCGCLDIRLPGHDQYPGVKYCASYEFAKECKNTTKEACRRSVSSVVDHIHCALKVSREVLSNIDYQTECHCFPPCHSMEYEVTYSSSKWPADSQDGEWEFAEVYRHFYNNYLKTFNNDSEKFQMYKKYYTTENRHVAKKDSSKLTVYLSSSNVVTKDEMADYPQSQLLSDIGGQLGLWMGISILTLLEVVELIIMVCKSTIDKDKQLPVKTELKEVIVMS